MFVSFLRRLGSASKAEQKKISGAFAFTRYKDFQSWTRSAATLAYDLENLAPALANNGPNPEYPWPQVEPEFVPVTYDFDIWTKFAETGRGREFLRIIDVAVKNFPAYG